MADDAPPTAAADIAELISGLFLLPPEFAQGMAGHFAESARAAGAQVPPASLPGLDAGMMAQWSKTLASMQALWPGFRQDPDGADAAIPPPPFLDPAYWQEYAGKWLAQTPLAQPEVQQRLAQDAASLWQSVAASFVPGAAEGGAPPALPRADRRFADARWREQPLYAIIHQTYLMIAEQVTATIDAIEGLDPLARDQLRFATRTLVDALSPANFPLTNPVVMERAIATDGQSLVKGMEHMLADLRRGQLSHTDASAFRLGENIASTPGKVVHQTRLFQLIQYTPTTPNVLATPLVIFPPWINRFYVLDLNREKSFVHWAVDQGITVFMVSWKSADETMADVVWDDYIRAQIEAIDIARARLDVPAVHTIGYCVAGTTLAATLAVLARRDQADRVKSATFFTAQVDFAEAGELKHFIDDTQIATIEQLAPRGYVDGRYMAAAFNLLRGNDLIWSYVVRNYLLGEDYAAFDLLHWNGDTTNLPARWHSAYLKDLYRDNRLVEPDALSADGTPIDLTRITTPCYIQAGRQDHIAPAQSVWKMTRHLAGPWRFVLAGSGHIAGVVNPPAAGKYEYWLNPAPAETLDAFIAGSTEHKGSWWPDWLEWLRAFDPAEVPARGKRKPGGRGDPAIEDAPGAYVRAR